MPAGFIKGQHYKQTERVAGASVVVVVEDLPRIFIDPPLAQKVSK